MRWFIELPAQSAHQPIKSSGSDAPVCLWAGRASASKRQDWDIYWQ
jgi:hypothetical protein